MDTLQLSPADNIVVLTRGIEAGEMIFIGDQKIPAPARLGPGHKLASRDIRRGEKILKYGAPIGSASRNIQMGEHVHLHNLQSDYLPTFTLDPERQFHLKT